MEVIYLIPVLLFVAVALQLVRFWQNGRRRYWNETRMRADAAARFRGRDAVVWFPFAWYPLTVDEIFAIAGSEGYAFRTAHRHRGVPFLLFARVDAAPRT
ncbi:hypothetical protein LO772_12005 [Yinghuangia sp. ASG 101]|uniref:hypothetical protein n=1 Tax=Yinghuangia sp. ASG 101 TaxID=2896848 RepID=UPI001E5FF4E1|nr:hypothetical protein [Yinghuangia sp. ASG 101]UGQ14246.1 hypothetical protein LO772_12005 [Yinghuangia sp. ASG 101]